MKGGFYQDATGKRFAVGLRALADYLFISPPTASAWKQKGRLNGCFKQIGKQSIIVNLDLIDERLKPGNHLKNIVFYECNDLRFND